MKISPVGNHNFYDENVLMILTKIHIHLSRLFIYYLSAIIPDFCFFTNCHIIICILNLYQCVFISLDPLQCFSLMCFGKIILLVGVQRMHNLISDCFYNFLFCSVVFVLFIGTKINVV